MVPDDPQQVTTPRRSPISRRLRFEILRRDGHTCRYCGGKAPDVALTVDHVIPVTLGGSDDPSNLVTACSDCNAGKASIPPDASVVADVAADALRWKQAIEQAQAGMHAERQVLNGILERFEAEWNTWTYSYEVTVPAEPFPATGDPLLDKWHTLDYRLRLNARPVSLVGGVLVIEVEKGCLSDVRRALKTKGLMAELNDKFGSVESVEIADGWSDIKIPYPNRPTSRTERATYRLGAGWQDSIENMLANGLPEEELLRLIRVAMEGEWIKDRWRWFCGCCWRKISDLQEDARRIIESETEQ
jgi:hypothetical protein